MKANNGTYVPISTVDWHGKSAGVIFLRGCPLRCPYCHNHEIIGGYNKVSLNVLERKIEDSIPFITCLVISGGEPLTQKDVVKQLAKFSHKKNLQVGLHTNGTYPDVVKNLIKDNLIDYFFLDIKAPLDDIESYSKVIGYNSMHSMLHPDEIINRITKSLEIICESNIELEIRTTIMHTLIETPEHITAISKFLMPYIKERNSPYVIQQGLPANSMSKKLRKIKPYTREELFDLSYHAYPFLKNVWIRTKDKGNERAPFNSI